VPLLLPDREPVLNFAVGRSLRDFQGIGCGGGDAKASGGREAAPHPQRTAAPLH
jgi:hypothetical protein